MASAAMAGGGGAVVGVAFVGSETLLRENVRFILRRDEIVGRAHDGGRLTLVDACLRTPWPC